MISREQFAAFAPKAKPETIAALFADDAFNQALARFEINTPARIAAFLAQCAHESGGFIFFEEIWGPTAAQRRYEGRADLGNSQPGDGKRFKGRGPIQITGRSNYREFGQMLGLPLEESPELAAQPTIGFLIACAFWAKQKLNWYADINTDRAFQSITLRINGGLNGWPDRKRWWEKAKRIFK